jgi:hypothetical protein
MQNASSIALPKENNWGWEWWLKPVILAAWKAEIGRITIRGQSKQKVYMTPSQQMAKHSGVCLSSGEAQTGGWA